VRIEFSLAPAVDNLQDFLHELEDFVNSPCQENCKQDHKDLVGDMCSTCTYIRLSNSNAYPVSTSFKYSTDTWTGNIVLNIFRCLNNLIKIYTP
jgi:hypothetical protein